jgi:hypothetical protein
MESARKEPVISSVRELLPKTRLQNAITLGVGPQNSGSRFPGSRNIQKSNSSTEGRHPRKLLTSGDRVSYQNPRRSREGPNCRPPFHRRVGLWKRMRFYCPGRCQNRQGIAEAVWHSRLRTPLTYDDVPKGLLNRARIPWQPAVDCAGCPEDENCGSWFYEWTGSGFRLLRKIAAASR